MRKKLLLATLIYLSAASSCLAMSISVNYIDDACSQGSGWAWVSDVYGGVPPYTYLWSNSATTDTVLGLSAGTYVVTVTDAGSNSATASITIVNNSQLQLAYNYSYVTCGLPWMHPCPNLCNGAIGYCYPFGGTPPYNITSSMGTAGVYANGVPYVSGLCHGDNVNITITDALGCFGTDNVIISGPDYPNPVLSVTGSCNSMSNGSLTITLNPPDGNWIDTGDITDTLYNIIVSQIGLYAGTPITIPNLAPGNYFLSYGFGPVTTPCPIYFPFTIPDLGPNCSNIEGNVFVDLNANCTQDAGETGVPNTIIEFTPGPIYTSTDAYGHYSAGLNWGNYNMTHYPPATLTPLCPTSPFPISLSAINMSDTVNFADTSNIAFDAGAYMAHGTARPGFSFDYAVHVYNLSYASSGMLTVTLNYDPLLTFVSASPAPFSTSSGQVVWHLGAISNFQSAGATVTLSVPNNPALIGDTLNASLNVQATTPETNLVNNNTSTWHIIMGAFDPNMKTVEAPAASFIPAADGWFNYTIQFQNTGNDTAFNVEVIDTLDADLDVVTFVNGASSHPCTTQLSGAGVVHFIFNNILLPDSTTDEAHSHGFVSFQIRSKQNLANGITILNKSDIIFDFNPPVATNTTTNTVDLTLAINATATTICTGQSVTLTMIPELQNAWRWRAGNCSASIIGSGNSITVSPAVTTTYFVRDSAGTIPAGACYRKTIIVNPSPTASITPSGPTTFCQGNSLTLTSSTANSYLWSNSSSTQSINVAASGNYAVTVTAANGCTASSSAISVTVNPLPTASITPSGPTTFCQGNSVTLTSSAASSYLWSNSSSTQNINVTSSGNYVVTVTDANNCTASSSAVSVTVNPLPTASISTSGPTTFCQGDSVILTSSAANTYLWSNTALSQSINVTSSGIYAVTITDANACTASSSVSVTVSPNPPAPVITQAGDSLTSDAAVTYQWYFNSVLIPGATSQSYHPTQNGNYSVVVSDANNCTASSTDYPFVLTNIDNFSGSNEIQIYPNPARGELVFRSSEFGDKCEITINSLIGETILSKKPTAKGQEQVIDVSALPRGIYFIKVKLEEKIVLRKIVLM